MSYGMKGPCVGRIGPGVSLYVGGGGGVGGKDLVWGHPGTELLTVEVLWTG